MQYIYVLKLKSNKYYVGKTENPKFRLNDHFNSNGSEWTKKYKAINVHELRPDCDNKDETIVTQEYMKKYGIDNVRGGPWCKIDISEHKNSIQHMIKSENDVCYKCGKSGHFANQCSYKRIKKKNSCERCGRKGHCANNCYAKIDINGNYLDLEFDSDSDEFDSDSDEFDSDSDNFDEDICFRCRRQGHYANNCYARTDIYNNYI